MFKGLSNWWKSLSQTEKELSESTIPTPVKKKKLIKIEITPKRKGGGESYTVYAESFEDGLRVDIWKAAKIVGDNPFATARGDFRLPRRRYVSVNGRRIGEVQYLYYSENTGLTFFKHGSDHD